MGNSKKANKAVLSGVYLNHYRRLKRDLAVDVPECPERSEALLDLRTWLEDACARGVPEEELFPDGYDVFYAELLSSLPVYSPRKKRAIRVCRRVGVSLLCVLLAVTLVVIALERTGVLGCMRMGMPYVIVQMRDRGYDRQEIEGAYSVEIDLSDPDSNIGKTVYDDGSCRIAVSAVRREGDPKARKNHDQYVIGFRSTGPYSYRGAELVSGADYDTDRKADLLQTQGAQITAESDTTVYRCWWRGTSLQREGDEFSYTILPEEECGVPWYRLPDEKPERSTKITVTLSGLRRYHWWSYLR